MPFLGRKYFSLSLMIFLLAIIDVATWAEPKRMESKPRVIHFFVVHKESNSQNMKLIRQFGENLKAQSNGELEVKIDFSDQSTSDQNTGKRLFSTIVKVYGGEVEMSQVAVDRFLPFTTELDVVDMPLIFKSHFHAEQVLDGSIGDRLRTSLLDGSNQRIRGLAFTYSGGWRNIYSVKNVRSLDDLKGQRMLFRGGRMGNDMMHFLGIDASVMGLESWLEFKANHFNGLIQAEEAETNRLASYIEENPGLTKAIKTVIETKHSLYLTLLIINEKFFKSLSTTNQLILQREAVRLAHEERKLSIQQEVENREMLIQKGIKFVQLNKKDKAKLTQMASLVQNKYRKELGTYIDEISTLADSAKVAQEDN